MTTGDFPKLKTNLKASILKKGENQNNKIEFITSYFKTELVYFSKQGVLHKWSENSVSANY